MQKTFTMTPLQERSCTMAIILHIICSLLQIAEPQSQGTKPALHVNFDPELMLLLREVHYLGGEPVLARLPDPARVLLRSTDDSLLRSTATRLDTIVSRYNSVMTNMKEFEQPLFERKLAKIDEVGK